LPGGRTRWLLWAAGSLPLTAALAWLSWNHDLLPVPGGIQASGSTWADFGLHASLISHAALASQLPLDMPLAAGTHLTYPFLIDLLSALFVRGGWSLHAAVFWPTLLLMAAIVQLLVALSLRLFGRLSAAVISLWLILLNGSAAGLDAAWHDWRTSGLSLGAWLSAIPRNYSGLDALNVHFNNFIADILLPQRPFLFGLSVFLVVATLVQAARTTAEPVDRRRYQLTAAALVGLLPLAHAHSFIAAMVLLAGAAVEAAYHRRAEARRWLTAIGLTLLIAAPQLIWQQLANNLGTGGHLALGWMVQPGDSLWAFWWRNFGLAGPYLIALPALLLRPAWRRYLVWYLPFLALLIITQIYSFQPYEYDNLKLILYAYLMGMLLAGIIIVRLIQRWLGTLVMIVPAVIVLIVPGALTVTREFQLHDQFASTADIALTTWVRGHTPTSAVFITTDQPNHPIATLAGRSIVLGYRGWLYNYHLPYQSRQAAVEAALQGQASTPLVQQFHASYLAVSNYEPAEWQANPAALDTEYPVLYRNDSWTVYQLPQ
jgi:hypothetical protein